MHAGIYCNFLIWLYLLYIFYKRQSASNVNYFYFMLFTSLVYKNLIKLQYNISKGIVIFWCCLHLLQKSSSTPEQEHVLQPVSAVTCVSCFAVPHHWNNAFVTDVFERTKQVIAWWCGVRTAGCSATTSISKSFLTCNNLFQVLKFAIFCFQGLSLIQHLTLRLLMSYIYGAPSKARNANIVYICTYVWQRWNSLFLFVAQCFNTESMQRGFLCHICV